MIKDELRIKMRAKRRTLTIPEIISMSESIRKNLFFLDCFKQAMTVCLFLSAFNEPETLIIAERLWTNKRKVIVPVSDISTNTLSLSYIDSHTDLRKGAYGIPEPSVIKNADTDDIDIILVPGLAFDRAGGRMGFGKGYYDRLLKNIKAVKIGLCYNFQLFDYIPKENHDIPMDYIITEKETIKVR